MSDLSSTDRVHAPLGKRGAFEGVARRHGRRPNPARTTPPSSLRTLTNQPRHSTQRWVEKCDRSVANSETPQLYTDDTPLTPADPVARAQRSPAANKKAGSHHTPDGLPAYNLTDLINELGTICRNQLRIGDSPHTFPRLTNTNTIQAKALQLLNTPLGK